MLYHLGLSKTCLQLSIILSYLFRVHNNLPSLCQHNIPYPIAIKHHLVMGLLRICNREIPFPLFMTKITYTWCPNCEGGYDHTDLLISTKFHATEKINQGSGVWIMLRCDNCGIKHSAGFKMYNR